jgi:predicted nucleic acid-binding protein
MNLCYFDTSVLLVYTLASGKETERYVYVKKLFDLIEKEDIKAITSFYALHELYIFALENAPDFEIGCQFGKDALNLILTTKIQVTPLLNRMEKLINKRLFKHLADSTDMPHAISAKIWGCDVIVAYDEHFQAISDVIDYKTPEEILANVAG